MTQERRRSNRMEINVKVKLNSVKTKKDTTNLNKDEFEVEIINISKDGIAFKSNENLEINTYYDTTILLWTKEKFESVIEIVRTEEDKNDGMTTYGCKFIGIMPSDQLKIQIYEMVNDVN